MTLVSITVTPASALVAAVETVQLTATATYSDDTTADVTESATWTTSASAIATVNTTGLVAAVAEGTSTITATVDSRSGNAEITVLPAEPLPPDPALVAPPIDPTIVTTVFASTQFLYTGRNPIQTGVVAGTIERERACVLRGRVLNRDGAVLPGVAITILDHPELGSTKSRADGMFDIVVNGGGPLTVVYRKNGFIETQRQVPTEFADFFGSLPINLENLPREARLWRSTTVTLGHVDLRTSDVAGWNLDIHHVYDPVSQTVYVRGHGERDVRRSSTNGAVNAPPANGPES